MYQGVHLFASDNAYTGPDSSTAHSETYTIFKIIFSRSHFVIVASRRVAADYVFGHVCVRVCCLCLINTGISKISLWIFTKFVADTSYIAYSHGND